MREPVRGQSHTSRSRPPRRRRAALPGRGVEPRPGSRLRGTRPLSRYVGGHPGAFALLLADRASLLLAFCRHSCVDRDFLLSAPLWVAAEATTMIWNPSPSLSSRVSWWRPRRALSSDALHFAGAALGELQLPQPVSLDPRADAERVYPASARPRSYSYSAALLAHRPEITLICALSPPCGDTGSHDVLDLARELCARSAVASRRMSRSLRRRNGSAGCAARPTFPPSPARRTWPAPGSSCRASSHATRVSVTARRRAHTL